MVEVAGHEPEVIELEGFAAHTFELTPAGVRAQPGAGAAIESDRFRVQADGRRDADVLDKRTGRRFERLHSLEDEADMGDLYNFCPVEGPEPWRSVGRAVRVLPTGPPYRSSRLVRRHRPAGLETS